MKITTRIESEIKHTVKMIRNEIPTIKYKIRKYFCSVFDVDF